MDCNCGCQSRVLVTTSRGRKQSRKVRKYSCKLRGTTGPARTQCFPLLSQRSWTWQQDRGPAKSVWHWQGIAQCFHQVLDPGWEALELAAERESVVGRAATNTVFSCVFSQVLDLAAEWEGLEFAAVGESAFRCFLWLAGSPWTMSCISSHLEAMAYDDRVSF